MNMANLTDKKVSRRRSNKFLRTLWKRTPIAAAGEECTKDLCRRREAHVVLVKHNVAWITGVNHEAPRCRSREGVTRRFAMRLLDRLNAVSDHEQRRACSVMRYVTYERMRLQKRRPSSGEIGVPLLRSSPCRTPPPVGEERYPWSCVHHSVTRSRVVPRDAFLSSLTISLKYRPWTVPVGSVTPRNDVARDSRIQSISCTASRGRFSARSSSAR
jgi:hypothetical protein